MNETQIKVIGTFHKSGTVLLKNIFSKLAETINFKFIEIVKEEDYFNINFSEKCFYFDNHSRYLKVFNDLKQSNFKFIQCIRDPRDLVVSATKYHQTSKEQWLHEKLPEFNGSTYNLMINSCESFEEKCFFEIKNQSNEIMENLKICSKIFSKNQKMIKFIKLEDLMQDYNYSIYKSVFNFLKLEESYLLIFLKICKVYSIWNIDKNRPIFSDHIQHSTPGFWEKELPVSLLTYINEKWPNLIEDLKY